ncbi:hypothetical protein [Flavisolibacter ginsenosidimutans]|uniref:Uncharacterized protein n=1 Tax=Flavisolibacter ginsenosidimutans TaxID=661481 RepID=A0A5B8UM13_9BACT|nr:hypothetical protein [Flavisolibacter ginsenosidimutans]QEC57075.1 hypothetical protein FSB75_14575 [Flavisolibacter ginsenosidimutans]
MHKALFFFFPAFFTVSLKAASQQRFPPLHDTVSTALSLRIVPQNFYKQCLPLSCKGELQLQKLTSLPVYFRVGSKDYVDYLEKKPNAVKMQ